MILSTRSILAVLQACECMGVEMKLLVIGKPGRFKTYSADYELYQKVTVVYVTSRTSDDEMLRLAADADMILADAMAGVSAYVINQMPNLKIIHSEGVGYNFIDIEAARARKIYVCNCKGINAMAVAEQTILLMLGLLRDVCNGDKSVRLGKQIDVKERYMQQGNLRELGDCSVGLLGFGDIAKCVAKMLQVFGSKTYYYSRSQISGEAEKEYQVTYLPMEELLATCDVVSLHLPVTKQTHNIAGEEFFAKMKIGAYLVNTARGELVDSVALTQAIREGKLSGAGLDTIADEPVAEDNILLQSAGDIADKLILSCHIGGITASSFKRGYEMIWSDFGKVMAGDEPEHIVNPWNSYILS